MSTALQSEQQVVDYVSDRLHILRAGNIEISRNMLKRSMELNEGELLPPDHPFTLLTVRVAKQLGIPEDVELILVDDEDDYNTHFSMRTKSITLSRSSLSNFKNGKFLLQEDHVAALLAHEITHARERGSWAEATNIEQEDLDRTYKYAGHAEEHEADRLGMILLAEAGYNPQAMVEFAENMLDQDGNNQSTTHPEALMRMNHLKKLLFDDEHPIINTDKEMTPLEDSVKEWIFTESKSYEDTDLLLGLNPDELDKRLVESKSIEEFLIIHKHYIHARRAVEALELARSQSSLDTAMTRVLALNAIQRLSKRAFDMRDELEIEILNSTREDIKDHRSVKNFEIKKDDEDLIEPVVISAAKFRQHYLLGIDYVATPNQEFVDSEARTVAEVLAQELSKLINLQSSKDSKYSDIFIPLSHEEQKQVEHLSWYHLYNADLSLDNDTKKLLLRSVVAKLLDIFTTGTPTPELIAMNYPNRDSLSVDFFISQQTGHMRKSALDFIKERAVDLAEEWPNYFLALKESAAMKIISDVEIGDRHIQRLADLIELRTTIRKESALAVAEAILSPEPSTHRHELETLNKKELWEITKLQRNIDLVSSGRISPKRSLHKGFVASMTDTEVYWGMKRYIALEFNIAARKSWKDELIRATMLNNYSPERGGRISRETFMDEKFYLGRIDDTRSIDISAEQWEDIYAIYPDQQANSHYRAAALMEYFQLLESGSQEVPLYILDSFKLVQGDSELGNSSGVVKLPSEIDYTNSQLEFLLINVPWGKEWTYKSILNYINFKSVAYKQGPESIADCEAKLKILTQISTLELDTTSKYNKEFYHTINSVRSRLMHMHIDNIQYLDKSLSDTEALKKTFQVFMKGGFLSSIAEIDLSNTLLSFEGFFLYNTQYRHIAKMLALDSNELLELADGLEEWPSDRENLSVSEGLSILALFDVDEGFVIPDLPSESITFPLPERILAYLALANGECIPQIAQKFIDQYGENVITYLKDNFRPSNQLSRIMAMVIDMSADSVKKKFIHEWLEWINVEVIDLEPDFEKANPHIRFARNSTRASQTFLSKVKNHYVRDELMATNKEDYEDLARRRHPFASLGVKTEEYVITTLNPDKLFPSNRYWSSNSRAEHLLGVEEGGSISQRLIAVQLEGHLDEFVDQSVDFESRRVKVNDICPVACLPRDIVLEMMIRTEIDDQNLDIEIKFNRVTQLMDMFASREYLAPYIGSILDELIAKDPTIIDEVDGALDFVVKYLPGASLVRNHYLNLIAASTNISYEQSIYIQTLRLNEELRTKTGESDYTISIFNQLSSGITRPRKRETLLWIMRLIQNKPGNILNTEKIMDADLTSIQLYFAQMTPEERSVVLENILLGSKGLLDTYELVDKQLEDAVVEKQLFLTRISEWLIADTVQKFEVFREIFVTILEQAEPVRATQIITKLVNKYYELNKKGLKYNPEEALADALCSLGVVGKKVAQSLAEMDLPDEYRIALAKAQEEADPVPKGAIIELARQNNLIDGSVGIKIVSFGSARGAASNKQAIDVIIEITGEEYAQKIGQPVGTQLPLIGKFKRPSAQKVENLRNDLKLLGGVMVVLEKHNLANKLPPNFQSQVETAIKRELRFSNEAVFSQALRAELAKRPRYKNFKLMAPEIIFASDDIILETEAAGRSLRAIMDDSKILPGKVAEIKAAVTSEILIELLTTGRIHADLHPANIFVDLDSNTICFIDLGMNITINQQELAGTRKLLLALVTGNHNQANTALNKLGWEVKLKEGDLLPLGIAKSLPMMLAKKLNSKVKIKDSSIRDRFITNIQFLLNASRNAEVVPPENIGLIILAMSKFEPYLDGLSVSSILDIVKRFK